MQEPPDHDTAPKKRFAPASEHFVWSILPTVVGLVLLVSAVAASAQQMPGAIGVAVAIGGGILFGLGALTLRAVLRDARSLRWIRSTDPIGETPPDDGHPVVVEGTIRCDGARTAPISGERCAAYFYRIGQQQRALGDSTGSRRVFIAAGLYMAGFAVDTGDRSVPVQGLPEVDDTLRTMGSGKHHEAAVTRLLAASVSAREAAPHTVESLRLRLRQGWSGPVDESVRAYTKPPPADHRLDVQEEIVPVDRTVCVLGCFDALRGGVRPGRARALHLYAGARSEVEARLQREVRGFGITAAALLVPGILLLAWPWF